MLSKFVSTFLLFLICTSLLVIHFRLVVDNGYLFQIEPGETTSVISQKLYDSNLILSPKFFNFYSRLFSLDDNFKAGEYDLNSYESIYSLGKKFSNGDILYRKLTILPGMTLSQILNQGNQVGLINDLFVKDNILDKNFSILFDEGQFYPDTYFYIRGDTYSSILLQSQIKWNEVSKRLWSNRKANLPFKNLKDAITLASIIEKEGTEKELIASVFINRLNKNMKLQSDPTVIYALGKNFDGDLRKKDLNFDSPYNTYRYKGLPPSPISTVSEESLKAALNPADTNYLYFVSMGNGFHKFSKTLKEHNQAVREYQLNVR